MTSAWRGRSRRSNGSMVIRSVVTWCVAPDPSVTGPSARTNVSNARGQSSSVPSNSPIRCSTLDLQRMSAEPRQVVRPLGAPGRPVVRDVVPPQVQLVPDALGREQARQVSRGRERAGGVLPLPLAADQQDGQPPAQPVQVVAVEVY